MCLNSSALREAEAVDTPRLAALRAQAQRTHIANLMQAMTLTARLDPRPWALLDFFEKSLHALLLRDAGRACDLARDPG